MALRNIKKRSLNAVEIISENDDALDLEASDIKKYKETGDKSYLKFVPGKQPTVFLCNFELKLKQASAIKNAMTEGKDEDGNPKVALGSWSYKVVQTVLKDIINPEDMPEEEKLVYKKDENGNAHESVVMALDGMGVVNEIFAMYATLTSGGVKGNAKN